MCIPCNDDDDDDDVCHMVEAYLRKGTGTDSMAVMDRISLEQLSSQLAISIYVGAPQQTECQCRMWAVDTE